MKKLNNKQTHKSIPESSLLSNWEIPSSQLDIQFNQYNLSSRLLNVLNTAKIFKVRDLLKYSENRLYLFPNMGDRTMQELKDFLHNLPSMSNTDNNNEWKTFEEFAKNKFEGKTLDIILERYQGKTLEYIAQKHGLTRQRVLQICNKLKWDIPCKIESDKYKNIFTKYMWNNPDVFCKIFQEDKTCYYYLKFRYGYGKLSLKEFAKESNLTDEQRKKILNPFRGILNESGKVIFRKDVLEQLIKKYALNKISIEEFVNKYNWETDKYPELKLKKTTCHIMATRLRDRTDIVWCGDHSFRYYDFKIIKKSEIEKLLPTVDGFFSSMYIFKGNRELMEEWDIRDKNELHSVLKSCICQKNISFSRMPHFFIGNENKKTFLIKQAKKYSPINIYELTKILYDYYGLDEGSMASSLFSELAPYITDNNIIDMKVKSLLPGEETYLKQHLTADIYSLEELSKTLISLGFSPDKILKRHICRQIGYTLYSDFIISTRFDSVLDYLNHIIEMKGIIPVNDDIYKLPTIRQLMSNLQRNMQIFKLTEDFWITPKKLESIGISKEDITHLIDTIMVIFKDRNFFSVYNILDEIDYSSFEEKGLSETFLENIVISIPKINILRVSHNKLFSFRFKSNLINYFILCSIEQYGKITLLDLSKEIIRKYKIQITIERLKEILEILDDVFYSDILEKVYLDKNDYYREVFYEK